MRVVPNAGPKPAMGHLKPKLAGVPKAGHKVRKPKRQGKDAPKRHHKQVEAKLVAHPQPERVKPVLQQRTRVRNGGHARLFFHRYTNPNPYGPSRNR